jgi:hypothetical protein
MPWAKEKATGNDRGEDFRDTLHRRKPEAISGAMEQAADTGERGENAWSLLS